MNFIINGNHSNFLQVAEELYELMNYESSPKGSPKSSPVLPKELPKELPNNDESSPKSSPKTPERIFELITANNKITTQEIADTIGISKRAVLKHIAAMKDKVLHKGPSNGGYWEIVEK